MGVRDESLCGSADAQATLQTCLVHLIGHSLELASWKTRKSLAVALRPIYAAPSAEAAEAALDTFADGPWGTQFPTVVASWRRAWTQVSPVFAFPPDRRRVRYTTNVLENVNRHLRKTLKTRGHFPTDDATTTLIWLALRHIMADWKRPAITWKTAMNQFAILYADRFTHSIRRAMRPLRQPAAHIESLTVPSALANVASERLGTSCFPVRAICLRGVRFRKTSGRARMVRTMRLTVNPQSLTQFPEPPIYQCG